MASNSDPEKTVTETRPKIGVVDVQYNGSHGTAAMVCVEDWGNSDVYSKHVIHRDQCGEYEPGQFFRRELPCLLQVIKSSPKVPEVVVVDGYVWLDSEHRQGLGAKLFDALDGRSVVIGVAKTKFRNAPAVEILRGNSRNPLFVTAAGVSAPEAAELIQKMHGAFRIPTVLRMADQLARELIR